MMATREDFQTALRALMAQFEPHQTILTGLMGARVNNEQVVNVENQPGFVYVRLHGNDSAIVKAYNETLAAGYNLPVRLVRDKLEPRSFQIVGRHFGIYPLWPGQTGSALALHASQHQFGGGDEPGRDVVWVHKRQFTPMLARPASGTTRLYVEEDFYQWGSGVHYFPGQFSPDLDDYRPTGMYGQRYVTLYLDGDDVLVKTLPGDEFEDAPIPTGTNYANIKVVAPTEGINLAAALLMTGTTSIWWENVVDLRPINSGGRPPAHIYAEMHAHDVAIDLVLAAQDTWYQIIAFDSNGFHNGATPDHTEDHITILTSGDYQVSASFSGHSGLANDYQVMVRTNNGVVAWENITMHFTTAVADRVDSMAATGICQFGVGDTVEVWAMRTDGAAVAKTLTTDHITLAVTRLSGG